MEAYQTARDHRAKMAFRQFAPEELQKASELMDRLAGAIVSDSSNPTAVCMQCEIYVRDHCRFGEYGHRNCFYQRHKKQPETKQQDEVPAEGKVD
jgi:hypothetical protein